MQIERGANTKNYWDQKHMREYDVGTVLEYKKLDELSYTKVAIDILKDNEDGFTRKTVLEMGCADGKFLGLASKILKKDWKFYGIDFGDYAIDAAKKKFPHIDFQCRDILDGPIEEDYGCICIFETLEHFEPGLNYFILDDIMQHCEYAIISVPTTIDDCQGEHLSHYDFDTFEEEEYEVLWKQRLNTIDMSNTGDHGDFFYMIVLLRGLLK